MIGVDLGGTRIKAGKVDRAEVVESMSVETHADSGPADVLRSIVDVVRRLDRSPERLGLAIPGEVDDEGKVWRLPNVPGFEGVGIASELSERLGCPVVVENDATAAALGESLYGHGRVHRSFVLLTLGTGVGGGLALGGLVRRGAHGFAGEIGHILVNSSSDAWRCPCGQLGCMEAYAGTAGLLRKFRELGGEALEISEVAESARRGEEAGRAVFEMMGTVLGTGITSIQNVLDLDAIVFSGGISRSFDLVEPSLRKRLRERAHARPLGEVPLLVSELGAHAGLIGAAHLTARPSVYP